MMLSFEPEWSIRRKFAYDSFVTWGVLLSLSRLVLVTIALLTESAFRRETTLVTHSHERDCSEHLPQYPVGDVKKKHAADVHQTRSQHCELQNASVSACSAVHSVDSFAQVTGAPTMSIMSAYWESTRISSMSVRTSSSTRFCVLRIFRSLS